MHPALFLQEILRVIFAHLNDETQNPGTPQPHADLVSLARTCRVFKDPALDLLWMYLFDLPQLVRCLPSACRVKDSGDGKRTYALERDLEPAEADTVKAYARRVRFLFILSSPADLDPDTLGHLCRTSHAQTEPLFPNLRQSLLSVSNDTTALLPHVAVKNLRKLTLHFLLPDPSSCEDFMRSLSSTCPGIQDICVHSSQGWYSTTFSNIMFRNIRRWTHLQSMYCLDMIIDIDTLFYLSRLPFLTQLSFTVDSALIGQIETSNHVFVLPRLQEMALCITSMFSDSKFLTHMRLPALKSISMRYSMSPPRDMIMSFEMALRTVCNQKLLAKISLDGSASFSPLIAEHTTLVLEDLLFFAGFNLTNMNIDLDWIVDIKDDDLLRLASGCPRIWTMFINFNFGWRSAGITPVGLLKVLRLRPSLSQISIALDTRAYRVLPHEPESLFMIGGGLGDPLPSGHFLLLRVADSVIEAESVPALAAFFADCMPPGAVFGITSWTSDKMRRLHDNWQVYEARWKDVERMAKEMITERSKRLCSHGEE